MRKFLLPIINLVNIVLVSIVFGLANNTAVFDDTVAKGTYYQLVWNPAKEANTLGIVGFFLFVVAVAFTLFIFFPSKVRKFVSFLTGAMYITAGVLFLKTPAATNLKLIESELSGSLIAMAVLVFIAGAFTLAMSVLEFTEKKAK